MYEKLLNLLMKNGKKNTVRKIVNKALKKASLKLPVKDIHTILHTAIYNLSPDIELKSKRIPLGKINELSINSILLNPTLDISLLTC